MDERPDGPADREPAGTPVGRRVALGLVALGAAGVVGGSHLQAALGRLLAPIGQRDPSGLTGLVPLGNTFRFYSVTGAVKPRSTAEYRLSVSGEVATEATYSFADLQALPQTSFVARFQCVTGWHVPDVHWSGVRLSTLLDRAAPSSQARAVRIRSFDGTYTESLTMKQARRPDVIVALSMLGAPVTHDHGGPVRMYCASLYGYKSTKWLSGIEVVTEQEPGYWETRGYDLNGTVQN